MFYDESGRRIHSAANAATVEIAERTREGDELARTYLSRAATDAPASPPYPAAGTQVQDGDYADAVKATWDVWLNTDGIYTLVDTKDGLLAALGYGGMPLPMQRQRVSKLMLLPSWDAAPASLKVEVNRWLEDTRPTSRGARG